MASLEISQDRCFVLWSSLRTLPHSDKCFEKVQNFKCALRQRWKLFAQSTPKFGKITVARYEFGIKHRLTLDQSIHPYKAL